MLVCASLSLHYLIASLFSKIVRDHLYGKMEELARLSYDTCSIAFVPSLNQKKVERFLYGDIQ
jgi:hypothetical protein